MHRNHLLLVSAIVLMSSLGLASSAKAIPPSPDVDPADFVGEIDNPFFPLPPGRTLHYEGTDDGGVPEVDNVHVTHRTKQILGVTCTVVHDQVFDSGVLSEDTFDYYAQDKAGNVWYFGEDTKELDPNGNVTSTEGSWLGGVDGGRPGILMEANPQVGDQYRQEFLKGVAEDTARVLSLDESTCVIYGCFDGVLLTEEKDRLDPGVVDHKFYAKGIGSIFEQTVKGGDETIQLVSITN